MEGKEENASSREDNDHGGFAPHGHGAKASPANEEPKHFGEADGRCGRGAPGGEEGRPPAKKGHSKVPVSSTQGDTETSKATKPGPPGRPAGGGNATMDVLGPDGRVRIQLCGTVQVT